jgi:hypothetical protein
MSVSFVGGPAVVVAICQIAQRLSTILTHIRHLISGIRPATPPARFDLRQKSERKIRDWADVARQMIGHTVHYPRICRIRISF